MISINHIYCTSHVVGLHAYMFCYTYVILWINVRSLALYRGILCNIQQFALLLLG